MRWLLWSFCLSAESYETINLFTFSAATQSRCTKPTLHRRNNTDFTNQHGNPDQRNFRSPDLKASVRSRLGVYESVDSFQQPTKSAHDPGAGSRSSQMGEKDFENECGLDRLKKIQLLIKNI